MYWIGDPVFCKGEVQISSTYRWYYAIRAHRPTAWIRHYSIFTRIGSKHPPSILAQEAGRSSQIDCAPHFLAWSCSKRFRYIMLYTSLPVRCAVYTCGSYREGVFIHIIIYILYSENDGLQANLKKLPRVSSNILHDKFRLLRVSDIYIHTPSL